MNLKYLFVLVNRGVALSHITWKQSGDFRLDKIKNSPATWLWLQDSKTRGITWTLAFWLGMSWCPHPAQKFKGVLLKWLISLFSDTHALYQPSRSQSCCSAGVFVSAEQQTLDSFSYHLYTWSTTALQPEKHSATHDTAVISLSLNMIHFIGIIKIVKWW